MVQVPTWERKVQQQTPAAGGSTQLSGQPPEAFGMNVAEANQRLGAAFGEAAGVVARRLQERDQEEAERQVFEADTRFRQDMDKMLYDAQPGEDGRPKGVLARTLGAAKGSTLDLDTGYAALRKQYLDGFANPRQAEAMSKLMDTHFTQVRGEVIRHESRQFQEDYRNTVEANIKQRVAQAAAITSAKDFVESYGQARVIQTAALKQQGLDEGNIKLAAGALAADFTASYLKTSMEKDPAGARLSLEGLQQYLPADVYTEVHAKVVNQQFGNELIALKQKGKDKQAALKLTADPRFSGTPYEQADRVTAVNKAYAQTDPYLYRTLFRGVQAGTIKDADLDAAFNAGRLTQGDWEGLWKATGEARSGKTLAPEMKEALKNIELMVNRKYADPTRRAEAMFIMERKALAFPNPDVFYTEAKKSLDEKVVSAEVFHDSDEHGWKDELEAYRQASTAGADEINKAITVLERIKQPVTAANVEYLRDLWRKNPNDKRFQ